MLPTSARGALFQSVVLAMTQVNPWPCDVQVDTVVVSRSHRLTAGTLAAAVGASVNGERGCGKAWVPCSVCTHRQEVRARAVETRAACKAIVAAALGPCGLAVVQCRRPLVAPPPRAHCAATLLCRSGRAW